MPVLLVIVVSAASGAAAVVNGVFILFGTIKVATLDDGDLRQPASQQRLDRRTVAIGVVLGAPSALCLPDARRRPVDHRRSTGAPTATASLDVEPRSLVAAIDQGTTSSRCILFDRAGEPVASHQLEHAQITPRPGWVEHDADEILERVRTCVRVALREAGADARDLVAVGISDQRETTVVWSRRTGRPVAPRDRLAGHPDRRGRGAAGGGGGPGRRRTASEP